MKIEKSLILETNRFLLRIASEEDFPFIFSATRFEGFNDGMLWEPPGSEEELIKPLINTLKAWEAGVAYGFTIVEKQTNQQLGKISIRQTKTDHVWNIGFWTHPESQRKGVMTESVAIILRFGFEMLGAIRIEAAYATWNKASEKVLHRNGMHFFKYKDKGFQKKGEWVAENFVAIDRGDWEPLS